jgi:KipI family sensor histidine kinase inhibitor
MLTFFGIDSVTTTTLYPEPLFRIAGDRGIMMEFGETISPQIHERIRAMVMTLDQERPEGVVEYSPAYRSITILYNPLVTSIRELRERLIEVYQDSGDIILPTPEIVELPVCYGGRFGPDLGFVAASNNLSEEEVIRLHSQPDYFVYMLGFSPGFPFLGGLPEPLHTPRLESPRKAVPAGSVGIANGQTGVYPVASPGGWQLIGRTPLNLFDCGRDQPFLFSAGNILKFRPIGEEEFDVLAAES